MEDEIPLRHCSAFLKYGSDISIGIVAVILVTFLTPLFFQPPLSSQMITNTSVILDSKSYGMAPGDERDNSAAAGTISKRISKAEQLFHPIIQKAADLYGVEAALVKAIIMVESSYNPKAVSRKGAKGLMQLMPRTAESLGVEDSFDPEININAGVRYLKQLMTHYDGNTKLALAAYNAGMRHVRHYDGIPPFRATHCYIDKVYQYYNYYKDKAGQEIGDA